MARRIDRLSVKTIASKKQPGYYADGGGLYLQVSSAGSKSWVFRYMLAGKAREMGLGSLREVSLAKAREDAAKYRKLRRDHIDPIEARDTEKARKALEKARSITFSQCAAAYVKAHRTGWKNAKHASQWENTIDTYCKPVIGALPVQSVDTGLIMKVLEPMWAEKPETATRLRARIERILDWATVRGYRAGENPARWRGYLDKLLPTLKKKLRVKHHPALPFDEMPDFMTKLRAQEGVSARALEFTILTAARTGEAIGASWPEVDLNATVWAIPASRTKTHREHRVPLSPRAVTLLRALQDTRQGDFVFPGKKEDTPLSNMAMLELLKRMGRGDLTVHGFRSTFRDWAAERTNYPREVAEMALAHVVSDQTEAAYRRGDLFDKRRRLMNEWAKYCETPKQTGKVVPMRGKVSR